MGIRRKHDPAMVFDSLIVCLYHLDHLCQRCYVSVVNQALRGQFNMGSLSHKSSHSPKRQDFSSRFIAQGQDFGASGVATHHGVDTLECLTGEIRFSLRTQMVDILMQAD